jgi:hypothetical protein
MRTLRTLSSIGGAAGVVAAACAVAVGAHGTGAPSIATLAGSAVPVTARLASTGELASTKTLTVQLWLRPQLAAAQRYATAVSTPGSPMFRDFLSPDAYTARFGPTTRQASAVAAWLRSRGFKAVAADSQRDYVRATGSVARIGAGLRHLRAGRRLARDGCSGCNCLLGRDPLGAARTSFVAWSHGDLLSGGCR